LKENFPYGNDIKDESEKLLWKLYSDNIEFDLGLSYREIGQKVDEKFDIEWYQYDSERVRNVKRKFEKVHIDNKSKEIIKNLENFEAKSNDVIKLSIKNKILIVNDVHFPFNRDDVLDVIEKHKDEIRVLILGGDILDCWEISSFSNIGDYPIEKELVYALDMLHKIKSLLPDYVKIILINGNHEQRWKTFIAKQHVKGFYKFIDPNVLQMLKKGFTLYENGEEKVYKGVNDLLIINNWYVNINNELIVCHPRNFSRTEVRNAKMAIEYFISIGEEFSTLIVAHNHHQSEVSNYLGKYGVESGCMCLPFDYSEARTSSRPQDYGYFLAVFDSEGNIDRNLSRLYKLEGNLEKSNNSKIDINFRGGD
jgi:hypothetical protein